MLTVDEVMRGSFLVEMEDETILFDSPPEIIKVNIRSSFMPWAS
jgi:hypothetical protein